MSNSVFREFPSSTATKLNSGNNADPAGKNVVIVLNKDGSVSVDQNALHSFLSTLDSSMVHFIDFCKFSPFCHSLLQNKRR